MEDFEQIKVILKNELNDILVRAGRLPMAHQYEVVEEMNKMLEYELDGLNSAYEQ